MTIEELNERFGTAGRIEFAKGRGGLTKIVMSGDGGEGEVMLHGAHVTHFQPRREKPVLWVSKRSRFEHGRPIRGGVPVCWGWFALNGPRDDSPLHGFARLMEWEVESSGTDDEGDPRVTLLLRSNDETRKFWEVEFELRHTVTVGSSLMMSLESRNVASEPMEITEALHSYFAVSDIRNVKLYGLEGAEYLNKAARGRRDRRGDEPITFSGENDGVFVNSTSTCILDDPGMGRRIKVSKSGSHTTVIWNPWTEKARTLPDFGDGEWPQMLCIETANAHDNRIRIAPGDSHTICARIACL